MKLRELIDELNKWAPFHYQESYDNSGLLIGEPHKDVKKIMVSLDVTSEVVEEAINGGFDTIISHHPIIFKGLKSLTGRNDEEKAIMAALKNDIALVAMHTNLDNVKHGVNAQIAKQLQLHQTKILSPLQAQLKKLIVFIPVSHLETVRKSIFDAGAGQIGQYDQCSFGVEGLGTFRAGENTSAFVGKKGVFHQEKEVRMETIFPAFLQSKIINTLYQNHPYEEPAYDIIPLDNVHHELGAGMIGELENAMNEKDFLVYLKEKMNIKCIRHTNFRGSEIKKVALCGGSGSFLINAAKSQKADIFITGDVKYHEFFQAGKNLIVADIGHYESEQYTKELIRDFLIENFSNFAVQISEHQTNPINYF